MGDQKLPTYIDPATRAKFVNHLLNDLQALEQLLQNDRFETGVTRIGAEQEFCLVDEKWRPSLHAVPILENLQDPHFTTELAKYNLEINLDPFELQGDCFQQVENQLRQLLAQAKTKAAEFGDRILLTGILPSIGKNELVFDYMTPNPRYWALNNIIKQLRGRDIELHIRGVDELSITHDSVLFEACNTSFQMHLQINPHEFAQSYNWAQLIAAPVLGASTNSPLLLGRELWCETRIALFRQSIDLRASSYALKDQLARVTFGEQWTTGSVVDFYRNEIARYKIILAKALENDSLEKVQKGEIPKLEALALHNGTIYRWNRPCFGMGGGIPHLRIENRYIPSGPTVLDEMANFAFWTGLMMGRPERYNDLPNLMEFRDVKSNFIKAARNGKESVISWFGKNIPIKKLILTELLPMAREGLQKCQIDPADIQRLLGVIQDRVCGQNGSQWTITNYRKLRSVLKYDNALIHLTQAMHERMETERPVHEWDPITLPENPRGASVLVGHIMSRQLYTVSPSDIALLAFRIMEWKNIHHVPVEDAGGKLVGLLTATHINETTDPDALVSDIMKTHLITTKSTTPITKAMAVMAQYGIGCLPVCQGEQLVGILTQNDLKGYVDHPNT
ncbi:CBS domain-containing protein [Sediminicola luteus]|uniref:Signal transduction protein n=1 Tax=Sediminicola luteus TaxID=319238 RepID=A0A2A4GGE4_9FLAO|nr:CBS domain-containing protein [Sediminicola luteus]PCE66802.1 signal transduction protein [Sediminicola luteus]